MGRVYDHAFKVHAKKKKFAFLAAQRNFFEVSVTFLEIVSPCSESVPFLALNLLNTLIFN